MLNYNNQRFIELTSGKGQRTGNLCTKREFCTKLQTGQCHNNPQVTEFCCTRTYNAFLIFVAFKLTNLDR